MTSALLNFYRGHGADGAGRAIEDIWAWDRRRLEMAHDYMWLFPLPEPGRFNPTAPPLSTIDIAAFREDADLRARVCRSLDLMVAFYGLARRESAVVRRADFAVAASWVKPLNHNHLRLTRIMLFLRHVGLGAQAGALLDRLKVIAAHQGAAAISARTLGFWRASRGV
ncbi:MAG: opioid growth factor receptor-related protein [Legionella sp.]|nr:opioid growth factor receptor-related protein [Legionella sp.]